MLEVEITSKYGDSLYFVRKKNCSLTKKLDHKISFAGNVDMLYIILKLWL